jgi:hypothetical protein
MSLVRMPKVAGYGRKLAKLATEYLSSPGTADRVVAMVPGGSINKIR